MIRPTHCTLFGLSVSSELPLPGLQTLDPHAERVTICFGALEPLGCPAWLTEDGAIQLEVAGVARYRITRGREIVIDPAPGASERNLRVFLLGSAFGALLHQRGLLPLHANAIEIGGKAVAFLGRSGAGKSTLAAWFRDRGHPVLCDDVCAVRLDASGAAMAYPGIPRLRLWRDAIESSGRSADAYDRSFDGQDKFDVPVEAIDARPRLLAACYLLSEAGEGEAGAIRRLQGVAAVEALVANTYRGRLVRMLDTSRSHLAVCVGVVARTPVLAAERRWGRDCFDREAEALEAHAIALASSESARAPFAA